MYTMNRPLVLVAAGLLASSTMLSASAAAAVVVSDSSSSSSPSLASKAIIGAIFRRGGRRAQGLDDWGAQDADLDFDLLGDLLDGFADFDLCADILNNDEGLGAGIDGVMGFKMECTTDAVDGWTTISMELDEIDCTALPDPCVRDVNMKIRVNLGSLFEGLFGGGGSGSSKVGAGEMSFEMSFIYDEDDRPFSMEVNMSPMDLMGGSGGAGGGLLSSCAATLDSKDCECKICDRKMGIKMSCDGDGGAVFEMGCTDFNLAEEKGGAAAGDLDLAAAIAPRNLMIPRLVLSSAGGGNTNNACDGPPKSQWCESRNTCIFPQKNCLSEEALLAKRKRKRQRKRMFKRTGLKQGGKKTKQEVVAVRLKQKPKEKNNGIRDRRQLRAAGGV